MKTIIISVFVAVVSLGTQAHAQCGCREIVTKQLDCCGIHKGIQTCAGPTGSCNTCNSCAQQIQCCSDNLCSAGLGGSCLSAVTALNGEKSNPFMNGGNVCVGASKSTSQTGPAAQSISPGTSNPKTTGSAGAGGKSSSSGSRSGGA